jgi:hypothetical protein
MGIQVYIISQRGEYSPDSSRDLQRHVRQLGGYILMVTRNGPIVAIEDTQAHLVARHGSVDFMGPVTLNPHGMAATILQQIFAENLSKQLDVDIGGDVGSRS